MPAFKQTIETPDASNDTTLALAYEAMKNVDWEILFAGENTLVANTSKHSKTRGQQVVCTSNGGNLVVESKMIRGEMMDMLGTNKKNTNTFVEAFTAVKYLDDTIVEQNKRSIAVLKEVTAEAAARDQRDAAELDAAMNLSGSNLYATYTIIALNVLVFILMAIDGAGIFEANGMVHIKWGSNFSILTLSGDWWRLFTNIFIHFGIIHLLMNMYCLYMVGIYLEPMLGKARYIAAYCCTGVLASLVSLWWHKNGVNSAGASGAIFGIYGLFLAMLTSSLIPVKARQPLLQSIGIFVAYNLIYGVKSGVDNSAHIGGLVSGFITGYLLIYSIKKEREEEGRKVQWVVPLMVLVTLACCYVFLQQHTTSAAERKAVLTEVKDAAFKDNERFQRQLQKFDAIHDTVTQFLNDTTQTDEELVSKIDAVGVVQWQEATELMTATNSYDISAEAHQKAAKLLQYIDLRKKELELLRKMAVAKNTEALMPELNEVRRKAYSIYNEVAGQ